MPEGTPATGPQRKDATRIGRGAIDAFDFFRSGGAAQPGTYSTYREMLSDPTIALARATVISPILAGSWTFEKRDDAPADAVQCIQEQLEPMRSQLIREMLFALDFGWQAFELCGAMGEKWFELTEAKALLQDITEFQEDPDSGKIVGIKNRDIELPADKCMVFNIDTTPDNPYGKSRLENIRKHGWKMWLDCNESASRYDKKVAGVYLILHYQNKMIQMPGGADIDPFTDAQRMAANLAAGKMILSPEYPGEDEREGPKSHYRIEMVEDHGSRQPGFLERLRYADELKFRGYLRPERSGLSASTGGIGTSDTADMMNLGLTDGELLHRAICDCLNRQAVNRLLRINFGRNTEGMVYITPSPLVDRKLQTFLDFIKLIGGTPGGMDWLTEKLNIDAMIDAMEWPRSKTEDISIPEQDPSPDAFNSPAAEKAKSLMASLRA